MGERVWAFLHPGQWIRLDELRDFAQDLRNALADSAAMISDAHLSRAERDERVKRNRKIVDKLDRLTSRMSH